MAPGGAAGAAAGASGAGPQAGAGPTGPAGPAGADAAGGGGGGGRRGGAPWGSLDWLERSVRQGGSAAANPYLRSFVGGGLFRRMRAEPQHFSSLAAISSRRLRKEVTEAAAAVAAVERLLGGLGRRAAGVAARGRGLRVADLCAGKGWTSLFLAHRFPEGRFLMLDRDGRRDLRHLEPFPCVESLQLDICTPEAESRVRAHFRGGPSGGGAEAGAEGEAVAVAVLLGVHLCGQLSRVAVELWRACEGDGLLLCPCCLPKQGLPPGHRLYHAFGDGLVARARARGEDPHAAWCRLLAALAGRGAALARDSAVLSARDCFLLAPVGPSATAGRGPPLSPA